MTDWSRVRYFKADEFAHPDQLDEDVVLALDELRHLVGVPFHVTSDARVDNPKSLHYAGAGRLCRAIDFWFDGCQDAPWNWQVLWRMIEAVVHIEATTGKAFEFEIVPYVDSRPGHRLHHIHYGVFTDNRHSRCVVLPQRSGA